MSRIIPDHTPLAAQLVEIVAGFVKAGRQDLAVPRINLMLGTVWGEGWLAGMGEGAKIDEAATKTEATHD